MADVFAELYEMADIVVVDVGRYGFVMLKHYKPPHGFEDTITFTDSVVLFEGLWEEWLNTKLYLMDSDVGERGCVMQSLSNKLD